MPLGVVTGRPRQDAERFLEQHGIADLMKVVVCREDAAMKPDPAPVKLAMEKLGVRTAWMVGDAPDDILAARRARVLPLGVVAPGDGAETTAQALYQAGAARMVENWNQLEEWLP